MKPKRESARLRWERKRKAQVVQTQADKWIALVRKWSQGFPQVDKLDCSRESFYDDR